MKLSPTLPILLLSLISHVLSAPFLDFTHIINFLDKHSRPPAESQLRYLQDNFSRPTALTGASHLSSLAALPHAPFSATAQFVRLANQASLLLHRVEEVEKILKNPGKYENGKVREAFDWMKEKASKEVGNVDGTLTKAKAMFPSEKQVYSALEQGMVIGEEAEIVMRMYETHRWPLAKAENNMETVRRLVGFWGQYVDGVENLPHFT